MPPTPPELYDPATGTWTVTGDMPGRMPDYRSATLLSDGTVLVAVRATPVFGAELYDPGTGSWTATGTMLRPHNEAPATLLLDGSVLVAGGTECREGRRVPVGATGSAELYVPAGVSPPARATHPEPDPDPDPTRARPRSRPGRSRPAGRADLEGHGRQQEF